MSKNQSFGEFMDDVGEILFWMISIKLFLIIAGALGIGLLLLIAAIF